MKIVSLLLRAHSGTAEDRGGEDSHWYGRPRCNPLIAPAQPPLTRLGEPRIQPVPNRGPPATPDEEGGQAEEDEKGPPHDGPHLSLGDPPGHRLYSDHKKGLHASKPRIWPRLLLMLTFHVIGGSCLKYERRCRIVPIS